MVDVDGPDAVDVADRPGLGGAGLEGGEVDVDEHPGVGPTSARRPPAGRRLGPDPAARRPGTPLGAHGPRRGGRPRGGRGCRGRAGLDLGADLGQVAEVQVPGAVEVGPGAAGPASPDGVAPGGGIGVGIGLGLGALGLQVPHPPPLGGAQEAALGGGVDGDGVGHQGGLHIGQLPPARAPSVWAGRRAAGRWPARHEPTPTEVPVAVERYSAVSLAPLPGRRRLRRACGPTAAWPRRPAWGWRRAGRTAGPPRAGERHRDPAPRTGRAGGPRWSAGAPAPCPASYAVRSRHQPISMISVRARRGLRVDVSVGPLRTGQQVRRVAVDCGVPTSTGSPRRCAGGTRRRWC